MTYLASLNTNTIHAEAQQEAFVQLNSAGRRVPVVFSHVLFTHFSNTNNTRKGDFSQKFYSAAGAAAPSRSFSTLTKEVPGILSL